MSDQVKFELSENFLSKVKLAGSKMRQLIANEMNKGLREGRTSIVESLMVRTRLKRSNFREKDRVGLTRAKKNSLSGSINPLFGDSRMYLSDYPYAQITSRGKDSIKLESPIYRRLMRTGFIMQRDQKLLMLRDDSTNKIFRARGRTVPGLFESEKINQRFEPIIFDAIYRRLDSLLMPDVFG